MWGCSQFRVVIAPPCPSFADELRFASRLQGQARDKRLLDASRDRQFAIGCKHRGILAQCGDGRVLLAVMRKGLPHVAEQCE
jgi:hypothetical protein